MEQEKVRKGMNAIGRARPIETNEPVGYVPVRHTVDKMPDRELRHKLCKDVSCAECGVLDTCRFGQEARRRGLV